jgi:hypothetical protein
MGLVNNNTVTIQIDAKYADMHPTSIALMIGENGSKALRTHCENMDDESILAIWADFESVDKVATIRTLLNRASKKVLGYSITVKDGVLVVCTPKVKLALAAPVASDSEHSLTESNTNDMFMKLCGEFNSKSSDASKSQVAALMTVLMGK